MDISAQKLTYIPEELLTRERVRWLPPSSILAFFGSHVMSQSSLKLALTSPTCSTTATNATAATRAAFAGLLIDRYCVPSVLKSN